ncbi:MAG: serine/threonine-protein phosphatase [Desulfobacterales bacterium]|nr:serine/threonine-protein phosphatase [Desulfobacterales bacterium]
MSPGKKLLLAISPLVILSIALIVFSYLNMKKIQVQIPAISEFAVTSTELVQAAKTAFDRQSGFYEDVVFMNDLDAVENARDMSEKLAGILEKLRNMSGISGQARSEIDDYLRRLKDYTGSASVIYIRMSEDEAFLEKTENAQVARNLGEEKNRLAENLNSFSEIVRSELSKKIASVNRSAKTRNNINAVISSLVIAVSVLLIFFLIERAVTQPMLMSNIKLQKAMDALWGEMELARKLQTCLLPTSFDNIHPDFEIAATMLTADEVGGDFYEITLDNSDHLWVSIGDVSGHGVTPGLIMMMAQTVHTTVTVNLDCEASDVVVKINEVLYMNVHERLKESHFMTFTALKYLGEGHFQHAGAHLSMIVFRQKTGTCELIRTKGVYLNFIRDISKAIKNEEFFLDCGDVLVLYTDGLTEAKNPDGKMIDLGGFVEIVEKHTLLETEAMKDAIITDVLRWSDNKRADDMSLVIVKRKMII